MVKRKWVRFGIIPIEKKFGQVLVGCIRVKEGSAGLPWTSIALHCKETFSGPCTEAISRKVAFSVSSAMIPVAGSRGENLPVPAARSNAVLRLLSPRSCASYASISGKSALINKAPMSAVAQA